jgi:hypothetical protein
VIKNLPELIVQKEALLDRLQEDVDMMLQTPNIELLVDESSA